MDASQDNLNIRIDVDEEIAGQLAYQAQIESS
jgi:hypothetical protein